MLGLFIHEHRGRMEGEGLEGGGFKANPLVRTPPPFKIWWKIP